MSKQKRGNKKPKDTNAPKRPQSSYFIFSNKRRKEMKETNPDKKLTEISKMIAAEWKKLDDAAKKPYENEAKELKARYEVDSKKYKETPEFVSYQKKLKSWKSNGDGNGKGGKGKKTDGKRGKRLKDPNAPKKPQSAYFLFAGDRRPKLKETHPDKKITDLSKLLGNEWKEMSESDKKKWDEKAKQFKSKYDKDMEEYKKTDNYRSFQKKLKAAEKEKEKSSTEESGSESNNAEGSSSSGSGSESGSEE